MNARREYLQDLLTDCLDAVDGVGMAEEDKPIVVAALVLSDSLNGLRKALLQADRRRGGPSNE